MMEGIFTPANTKVQIVYQGELINATDNDIWGFIDIRPNSSATQTPLRVLNEPNPVHYFKQSQDNTFSITVVGTRGSLKKIHEMVASKEEGINRTDDVIHIIDTTDPTDEKVIMELREPSYASVDWGIGAEDTSSNISFSGSCTEIVYP